jgi:hypothetical protein
MGRACSTHVAKTAFRIFVGMPEINRHADLKLNGKIIVKWILDKMGRYGLNLFGSTWGCVEGSCEHGNKLSGFIKY